MLELDNSSMYVEVEEVGEFSIYSISFRVSAEDKANKQNEINKTWPDMCSNDIYILPQREGAVEGFSIRDISFIASNPTRKYIDNPLFKYEDIGIKK